MSSMLTTFVSISSSSAVYFIDTREDEMNNARNTSSDSHKKTCVHCGIQ